MNIGGSQKTQPRAQQIDRDLCPRHTQFGAITTHAKTPRECCHRAEILARRANHHGTHGRTRQASRERERETFDG
ncbi:predicted protein [Botrytis cinerea T4]|uniref:Uncharacterized protein n=1 Tax=Botryotinia fuckeliana (strain T4) TaxID=999810 RepID=G2YE60_BOTF4|nr:predicted protein [Botrytis cinerea T4]